MGWNKKSRNTRHDITWKQMIVQWIISVLFSIMWMSPLPLFSQWMQICSPPSKPGKYHILPLRLGRLFLSSPIVKSTSIHLSVCTSASPMITSVWVYRNWMHRVLKRQENHRVAADISRKNTYLVTMLWITGYYCLNPSRLSLHILLKSVWVFCRFPSTVQKPACLDLLENCL